MAFGSNQNIEILRSFNNLLILLCYNHQFEFSSISIRGTSLFQRSRLRRTLPLVTAALTALTPSLGMAAPPAPSPDLKIPLYKVPASQEPHLTKSQLLRDLRRKVKYVFVLYQENRSYDSYFGSYPGATGLYSQPASRTPGFYQKIVNSDGSVSLIHPFRISPTDASGTMYPQDTDDIDHSHPRIVAKMDIVNNVPRMDQFAVTEELKYSPTGTPSLKAKQYGELSMAYEDGDTVPFLWSYADRFVLFDHIFQEMAGPSTPGNLAILGAQTGATQAQLHPEQAYHDNGSKGPGVPILNDDAPFWGSSSDKTPAAQKMPVNPKDLAKPGNQINQTYATLPLTLAGGKLGTLATGQTGASGIVAGDRDQDGDLGDVADDVPFITGQSKATVPWGWYQEGFDQEHTNPNSSDPVDADGVHASYITHHNGPQYFGYIANNPQMSANLHGLSDFYVALKNATLPTQGGLFYVKGGYQNLFGLKPADPDTKVQSNFNGDDDHPAYSDAQISEAAIARSVNAIAASPYWSQCAIIITWDDSEGDYDSVPPTLRAVGPDGSVISDGPRVPLLVISPYAKTHTMAHDVGDHASVVKFADALFNLTPLADLPDELKGRQLGEAAGKVNQGPLDDLTSNVADLTSAFDPARLSGAADPLPASYAEIDPTLVSQVPATVGLSWVGLTPTDYALGIKNQIPADFNPRPGTLPGPLGPPTLPSP
jgi:phospholipase C